MSIDVHWYHPPLKDVPIQVIDLPVEWELHWHYHIDSIRR